MDQKTPMTKIYDINFKQKRLNLSYEDTPDQVIDISKEKSYQILDQHLKDIMKYVNVIAENDREFKNYCARALGQILASLRSRMR